MYWINFISKYPEQISSHISGALSFGSVCTSWLILAAHMYRKKAVTQDIQPVWSIRAVDHLV